MFLIIVILRLSIYRRSIKVVCLFTILFYKLYRCFPISIYSIIVIWTICPLVGLRRIDLVFSAILIFSLNHIFIIFLSFDSSSIICMSGSEMMSPSLIHIFLQALTLTIFRTIFSIFLVSTSLISSIFIVIWTSTMAIRRTSRIATSRTTIWMTTIFSSIIFLYSWTFIITKPIWPTLIWWILFRVAFVIFIIDRTFWVWWFAFRYWHIFSSYTIFIR